MIKKKSNSGVVLIIAFLSVICTLSASIFYFFNEKNIVAIKQKNGILTINSFKTYNLENFINNRMSELMKFGKQQEIIDLLEENLKTGKNSSESVETAIKELDKFPWHMAVLNKDAVILASVDEGDIGADYGGFLPEEIAQKNFFAIYYSQVYEKDMLAITSLIFENDQLLGAIGADVDLDEFNALAMSPFEYNSNQPLETFFINKDGVLLTPSKFIGKGKDGGVLVQKITDHIADKCKESLDSSSESNGDVYEYINYRGDDVYGTVSAIKSVDWCVITEFEK